MERTKPNQLPQPMTAVLTEPTEALARAELESLRAAVVRCGGGAAVPEWPSKTLLAMEKQERLDAKALSAAASSAADVDSTDFADGALTFSLADGTTSDAFSIDLSRFDKSSND